MAGMQRIGIYGGTFDPIHIGHLAIAEEARWALSLDQVVFVPAAQQPFKMEAQSADAAHRLTMARLACRSNPAFSVSDSELQRSPPSYTIDTFNQFRTHVGSAAELTLILGTDAARDLPRWHRARELVTLARFAVVGRPGVTLDPQRLEPELPGIAERLTLISGPQLAISSTELRRRLAQQQPIRYQIPEPVYEYIHLHGLYGVAPLSGRHPATAAL
jgi:nicotinate-nucleotide adenylyltransferase